MPTVSSGAGTAHPRPGLSDNTCNTIIPTLTRRSAHPRRSERFHHCRGFGLKSARKSFDRESKLIYLI